MSSSSDGSARLWNYPKLKGVENYQTWATRTKIVLVNLGLWHLVSELGGLKLAESSKLESTRDEEKAYTSLLLTIEDGPLEHVQHLTDASQIWSKLQSLYTEDGFSAASSLFRQLYESKLSNFDLIQAYLDHIQRLRVRLNDLGTKCYHWQILSIILSNLGSN